MSIAIPHPLRRESRCFTPVRAPYIIPGAQAKHLLKAVMFASSIIHASGRNSLRMTKIHEALRINFDAIEPTAGGYRLSNSSNPDRQSVWLSKEEWHELCKLVGWAA